ncbi:unnamed protein product [Paramecium pentaurelia]|uniref:Uncharacterized protein n=1 Tax=Paramecium pentaurelia TaxID=43138 RepID=A0A8S1Y9K8_9CILI|nr:unnamed protein product [Paramecium pentaurelia]
MKTSYCWRNQKVQALPLTNPQNKSKFENRLAKTKKQLSLHEQENWNDEHIIKYRNHLKDVRELRQKWHIIERPMNFSVSEKAKSEILDIEQSIQHVSLEKPKKKTTIRPFSSQQQKLLSQISQIYSFQSCANRQNKMKLFLQSDDNYANRSFRYYKNFTNYLNSIK